MQTRVKIVWPGEQRKIGVEFYSQTWKNFFSLTNHEELDSCFRQENEQKHQLEYETKLQDHRVNGDGIKESKAQLIGGVGEDSGHRENAENVAE